MGERKRVRYFPGGIPSCWLKRRLKVVRLEMPTSSAISSTVRAVERRSSLERSIRNWVRYLGKDKPNSSLKLREKAEGSS